MSCRGCPEVAKTLSRLGSPPRPESTVEDGVRIKGCETCVFALKPLVNWFVAFASDTPNWILWGNSCGPGAQDGPLGSWGRLYRRGPLTCV